MKTEFTPTSLRTYKICPYRFYLAYIIGLKPSPTIEEEPGPKTWGIIIHETLKLLYKEYYPEGYTKSGLQEVKRRLFSIFENQFKKRVPYPMPSNKFDIEIYKQRLSTFLHKEIERFDKGFIPFIEEISTSYEIMLNGIGKITLTGRPDRIDIRKSEYYIIDYKTGTKPDARYYKLEEDFREFELPLYALIFTKGDYKKIGGLIYYYWDKSEFKYKDIYEENYIENFYADILIPTIKEMSHPDIPFKRTDDLRNCRNCEFIDYCARR